MPSIGSPRRIAALLPVLGALLPLVAACDRTDSIEREADRLVPSVEAVRARLGALPLTQRLSGVVRAKNQIAIYPEITAVVTEVLVENGETVRAGQPVIRLRDTELRERLKQARASHRIAEAELRRAEAGSREVLAELERVRSLAERGLASRSELDTAEARAESAEAEVQLARARVEQALASAEEEEANLARTVLRAPIAGHVGDRDAEVGMLATPGSRLFTLGQLDSVRVEVILTDRMLAFLEEGQRAEVSTPEATASARLSRISPFLHPVSHSTEAEIDLVNPGGLLKPGMFVTVDVFYGESEQATLVPLSALYENPATGAVGVFVTGATLDQEPVDVVDPERPPAFTVPVPFEFVRTELVAQGRMEAAVRGVDPDTWVVTLGQNLLGGGEAEARVRPVQWARVERLQRLQREDLMQSVVERQASR
jgi:RND family efflux transporter MFP subunit